MFASLFTVHISGNTSLRFYVHGQKKKQRLKCYTPVSNLTQTTLNKIFAASMPHQPHATLYTGPTIHCTDTHNHIAGTRACNLSNSLMSCKQWREAKCYITWLLENVSPAKAYRWGHGDVMSEYTHTTALESQHRYLVMPVIVSPFRKVLNTASMTFRVTQ